MTLIEIENVTKSFKGKKALDGLSVSLPKGKIIGLVGPDGAGKTTLLRLVAALLLPTTGKIKVGGFDTLTQAESIHQNIGYMPQRFGLYEELSVMQNLVLYADLNGVVGEERRSRFDQLLAFTSLKSFTKRLARDLSGGMKQKLGLACTLIRKPLLLLLDEPSVGVDPISRRELWKMVGDLTEENISIIWSTAYLDEAEKCDQVILLHEGKLLYYGPPAKLTQKAKGRSFKITLDGQNRRSLLFELASRPDVIDATIQGKDLRIVTKKAKPIAGFTCTPTPPRFEDAFIDLLGGCPKGRSLWIDTTPPCTSKEEFVISTEHLTKKFGSFTAVDDISFKVKKGEVFGLLGPNGAGKSTTFRMLCGLLTITSGIALVGGKNLLTSGPHVKSHIGYMAQKFSLYGNLNVLQNLEFFSGVYQSQISPEQTVEIFGLKEYLNTNAIDLPLGFKQRLSLACSLTHHPSIVFLDEPTSGVDPITRREFWNLINGLVEKGTTIIVTTHFMDEAEYCDRIGLIFNGKIIHIGTPDDLKQAAATEKTPHPTLEEAFIHLISESHAI